ncbi:MAG TPA: hypothetical protein VFF81_09670 [Noviherbaspirillum sp.]|nr:hypothetical protein [Noviherbaspirillum sp.]
MPIWPLKLIAAFMALFGVTVLIALLGPISAQFMNPKIPITITAALVMVVGAGLFAQKRWPVYLFFLSGLLTYVANLISFGQPLVGKSWIGLLVVGVLAALYWKRLS